MKVRNRDKTLRRAYGNSNKVFKDDRLFKKSSG